MTAVGTFGGSKIDTLTVASGSSGGLSVVRMHGDLFALVYWIGSPIYTSYVVTFNVTSSGAISDAVISSSEFDSNDSAATNDSLRVNNNILLVTVTNVGDDEGFVKTINIADDGIIGSVQDTLSLGTSENSQMWLVHVIGEIYAVAYQGTDRDGFVKTFSVDSSGNISNSVISTLEFDTDYGRPWSLTQIFQTIFAVAYLGASAREYIKTFSIANDGTIGAVIDTLEVTNVVKGFCKVHDGIYAIMRSDSGLIISTLSIDNSGAIGAALIASSTIHSGAGAGAPTVHNLGGGVLLTRRWGNAGNPPVEYTYPVDIAGAIGAKVDDWLRESVGTYMSSGDYAQVVGYIWVCAQVDTTPAVKLFSFSVVTSQLPSSDITRVTGIRHIYRPGFFRMILSLGDVSNTIEIAEAKVRRELEIPEQQTPKIEPRPREFPEPTPEPPERRPVTIPTVPGVVTTPEVAEEIFGGFKPRTEPFTVGELLGATARAAIPSPIRKAWRAITPWREEAGETFGGEFMKRFRAGAQKRPGVLGIVGDIFRRFFGGQR